MIIFDAQRPYFINICFFIALLGTLVFLLNLLLSLVKSTDLAESIEAETSFKFLSFQGLSSFAMIFGWSAVALNLEFGLSTFLSGLAATVSGSATVMILRKLYKIIHGLHRSGTLDMANALLEEGVVYLRIPAGGVGKIQVPIQGRLCTLDAESKESDTIESGERVQVVEIIDNLLKVKRI